MEALVYTQDIKLAATLGTLGFPMRNPDPMEIVKSDNKPPVGFFYFKAQGGIEAYVKAWSSEADSYVGDDPNHALKNPEHPFWWMRAVLRSRERMLDALKKNAPLSQFVNTGGKTYFKTQWK